MPALLEPEGFGRTLLVCSIISASIAAVSVISRLCFRLRENGFGWDDILISLGLILYVGFAATCGYSAFAGLGARNETLESSSDLKYLAEAESLMFFIAMILYSAVLVCIKSAVCILFLQIAGPIRIYRICIFLILGLTLIGFVVTEAGIMGECKPFEANWKIYEYGKCISTDTTVVIASISTITAILTDWLCALFPAWMLWLTQIPLCKKLAAGVVLSLGALASICTLLRIPYIMGYEAAVAGNSKKGVAYYNGGLLVWSAWEYGIGLIATSLPPIWHAYQLRRRAKALQVLPNNESGIELRVLNRLRKDADAIHDQEARSIETS
ncbi:hypothetical protein PG988_002965 [Apiospora saccharicola]